MGASVISNPSYQALAQEIASGIGGGTDTYRGVLAQMACEKGGEWPPQDNNPLNVHVSAMASVGVTGLAHGIGDFGACARFDTPDAGAQAAATLLTRASRYSAAVQAAGRDDGAGYLRDVTAAGWGTSYSCAAGYYQELVRGGAIASGVAGAIAGGAHAVTGTGPASSGAGAGSAQGTADQWNQAIGCFNAKHPQPIHPPAGFTPTVPASQLPDLVSCANAAGIAITLADVTPYAGQSLSAIRDALAAKGVIPPANLLPIPDIPGAIAAFGQLLSGTLVELMVYGAILAGIVILGYLGVKRLAGAA